MIAAAAAIGACVVSALDLRINRRRIDLSGAWHAEGWLTICISDSGIHPATIAEVGVLYRPMADHWPWIETGMFCSAYIDRKTIEPGDVQVIELPVADLRTLVGNAGLKPRALRHVRFFVRTSTGLRTHSLRRWVPRAQWAPAGLRSSHSDVASNEAR